MFKTLNILALLKKMHILFRTNTENVLIYILENGNGFGIGIYIGKCSGNMFPAISLDQMDANE